MTESQILTYLTGRKTSVSVKELSQRFKKDPNCILIYLKRLMQQGLVIRKKSASKTNICSATRHCFVYDAVEKIVKERPKKLAKLRRCEIWLTT